jgi:hypothetical protein
VHCLIVASDGLHVSRGYHQLLYEQLTK